MGGSARDWLDVESIITRCDSTLDWALVEHELKPLLEIRGGERVWDRFRELRHKLREP